ncbi:MAG: hypothetical protein M0P39_16805 [Rhodocyclaceae bacterium]|jgi:hypothetical protein|nr:hypothetical protein [Rhodocyclaceae bacterium]
MKRNTLLALGVIYMALAVPSFAASDAAAQDHKHEPGAAATTTTLQLNAGKKWQTDAALRQAMGNIRQELAASLHEIHGNRLSNKQYDKLAQKVERGVGDIVANCKLEPKADAQLHLIVAELLEGAEQMAGKIKKVKRQSGAVGVIDALDKYSTYFDDPGFKPIPH